MGDAAGEGKAPGPPARPRVLLRRFWPLAALLVATALVFLGGLHRELSFDAFLAHHGALKQFVVRHWALALVAFAALYALAAALSVPGGAALTVVGGAVFGVWSASAAVVVGATLGATLLFLAARSALGDALSRRAGPRLSALLAGIREDATSYLLFLRLVPLFPFWLVNLAAALADVPLKTYVWTTFLGILPGTFAFAAAGAGLESVIVAQKEAIAACHAATRPDCRGELSPATLLTPEILAALVLLGLVALIPVVWRRLASRRGM